MRASDQGKTDSEETQSVQINLCKIKEEVVFVATWRDIILQVVGAHG